MIADVRLADGYATAALALGDQGVDLPVERVFFRLPSIHTAGRVQRGAPRAENGGMSPTRSTRDELVAAPETEHGDALGVEGNARLTGSLGAVLFIALVVEGITIIVRHSLLSAHVFVGMLLVPLVLLKTGSTAYRFVRYYTGVAAYTRKGAPPLLLRLAGPFVVITSISVLATGVGLLATGPSADWLAQAHKVSFVLWFGFMAVHVLGHVLETPRLAMADWRRDRDVPGAGSRKLIVGAAILAGLVLGVLSLGWIGAWSHASFG